jgi:hypothetical protein
MDFPISLTTALVLFQLAAQAQPQVEEHYYQDVVEAEGGKVHDHLVLNGDIIVSGSSFDTYKFAPSITRLDTLGHVLWTTTSNDTTVYEGMGQYVEHLLLGSDGFIYASCCNDDWATSLQEIWKVDAGTGQILWKRSLVVHNKVDHLLELDSSRIIVGYSSSYNGYDYGTAIAFIEKLTGIVDNIQELGGRPWAHSDYGVAVDPSGYIYYTLEDSLFKVDPSAPGTVLSAYSYPNVQASEYSKIHSDGNALYLFGSTYSDHVRMVSVVPSDLSMNWWLDSELGGIKVRDLVDRNGSLYATWQHIYVGGGTYYWTTNRVDKATGTLLWSSSLSMGWGEQAALSMDMDSIGDLYLTGYEDDSNYGPGNWGVAKLSGSTGESLFQQRIAIDPAQQDNLSWGIGACVIGDQPFFVGDLQTSIGSSYPNTGPQSTPYLVKLDPLTGAVERMSAFGGSYRFPSRTVGMEIAPDGDMVVLKQEGLRCAVEKYGQDSTLQWRRTLLRGDMLQGEMVHVDHLGRTIVVGQSRQGAAQQPFYNSNPDTLHLFVLGADGNLEQTAGFLANPTNVSTTQILGDPPGMDIYWFYHIGTDMYVRSLSGTTLSEASNLGLTYSMATGKGPQAREYSGPNLHVFAPIGYGSLRNFALDKNTLSITVIDTIPTIHVVSMVTPVGATLSLLTCEGPYGDNLVLYDDLSLDTVWASPYVMDMRLAGAVISSDGTKAYAYGQDLGWDGPSGALIQSISMSDGTLSWSHVRSSSGSEFAALDAADDAENDVVAFTGYLSNNGSVKKAFLEVLDEAGTSVLFHEYDGSSSEEGEGLCMVHVPNGSIWLGGYMGQGDFGQAGFMFRLVNDGTVDLPCQAMFNLAQALDDDSVPIPNVLSLYNTSNGGSGAFTYLWDFGDGSTSTGNTPVHSYLGNGPYWLCLTIDDGLGCTDTYCDSVSVDDNGIFTGLLEGGGSPGFTINVIDQATLGITELQSTTGITIWPNPASDMLYLNVIDGVAGVATLTVTDMDGSVVRTQAINLANGKSQLSIPVGELSDGLYMLRIGNASGYMSQRFLKMR